MSNFLSKKLLIVSFGIQIVGVFATFAISIFIARTLGANGQGQWATIRSVVDLASVLLCFGLPSAIPYFVNVKRVASEAISRASVIWIFFCFLMSIIILLIARGLGILRMELLGNEVLWLLATASTMLTAYGLWRALCLASTSTTVFNMVTVSYPLIQLAVLFILQPKGLLELLYSAVIGPLIAALISIFMWLGFRFAERSAVTHKIPLEAMVRFGSSNVLVSGLTAAQPAVAITCLAHAGAGDYSIGLFSIALLAMGAMLMPANILGPMIYNTWTRNNQREHIVPQYRKLFQASLLVGLPSIAVAISIAPTVIERIFGNEFTEAAAPTQILLLSVPIGYGFRLMCNVLMCNGHMMLYSLVTLVRLISMIMMIQITSELSIVSVACVWLASEIFAFISIAILLCKNCGWHVRDVFGF